jgi:ribonuclease HI
VGLKLTKESRASHIQIYGDSLLVIQWMYEEITPRNFTLQPLSNDVQSLLSTFSKISFSHIYKDKNKITDELSKAGIELE